MVNLSRRRLILVPAIFALLFISVACVGTVHPEGWAAPVFEAKDIYFLQSHDRVARAPIPTDHATKLSWVFPDKHNPAEKGIDLKAVYGSPVIAGGDVYLTSYSAGVFKLDQATGKPVWRIKGDNISGDVVGGAGVGQGLVAFGTTDGHFYVVNASDGTPAKNWPKKGIDLSDGIWAQPIVQGDTVYVATMGGDLYAYSLTNGPDNPLWAEPFHTDGGGAIPDMSLLDSTHLFVPSINHHVYIIDISDASKPKEQVNFKASDWVWTKPAFKDNIIYFGDFGGNIYGVDITKGPHGKMVWSQPANADGNRVKAAPAIVDNMLIVADRKPAVRFIDLKTGKQLNSVPLHGAGTVRAGVVAHDGLAYVVTTHGKLFVANPKDRSVTEVNVGGRQ